jgi:hypothetical protein
MTNRHDGTHRNDTQRDATHHIDNTLVNLPRVLTILMSAIF